MSGTIQKKEFDQTGTNLSREFSEPISDKFSLLSYLLEVINMEYLLVVSKVGQYIDLNTKKCGNGYDKEVTIV